MSRFDGNRWYPIARAADVPPRHVFHTALGDQELAIWRDDNGFVNVWENRCPHRGLRLTVGINLGDTLRCQYHGWTYETGSGNCTFVPAHPNSPAPTSSVVLGYPVREANGLVWAALGEPMKEPLADVELTPASSVDDLRGLPLHFELTAVRQQLREQYQRFSEFFGVSADALRTAQLTDELLEISVDGSSKSLRFYLQPCSDQATVIHAQACGMGTVDLAAHTLFTQILNEFRRAFEGTAKKVRSDKNTRWTPTDAPVDSTTPTRRADGEYVCEVVSRVQETEEIVSLRLKPTGRAMPSFTPGMHLSVKTPSGATRQYSIVNAPGENDAFVIGVKREAGSRGGSQSMHDQLAEGSELRVAVPRNGFPLKRTGRKPVLIAGGIGITPILSMAQALRSSDAAFELHYFVRGDDHIPFKDRFKALEPVPQLHKGLDANATKDAIKDLLAQHAAGDIDVYVCGPGPMIEAVKDLAQQHGLTEDAIRFEYFENAMATQAGEPFEVTLAQSGKTFTVPAGKNLVEVAAEHGVTIDMSCEQGVCGTCLTRVLEGAPEHRDLYLTAQEKGSGEWIMPCVSRARNGALVLDL